MISKWEKKAKNIFINGGHRHTPQLLKDIAISLQAAEKEGIERSAKVAENYFVNGSEIAKAIRKLKSESK